MKASKLINVSKVISFKSLLIASLGILAMVVACDDIFEENITEDELFLLAPGEGAVIEGDSIITFSWDFLEGASSYQIQVVSPSFENAGLLLLDSITNNNNVSANLQPGQYQWAVRGFNNGFSTVFFQNSFTINDEFISDFSQLTVNTLAPNGNLTDNSVLFAWDDLQNATQYQLQIASPSFTNPTALLIDTLITETNTTLQVPNGSYEWRVRAIDNAGARTRYTTLMFEVMGEMIFSELVVNIIAPMGAVNQRDVLFIWDELNNAENYQMQIATPSFSNPTAILIDTTLAVSNLTLAVPDGIHEWRIRAINDQEERTDFTNSNFNVEAN